MTLPCRPLPYPGESTASYLNRLAIRNRLESVKRLVDHAANDESYGQEGSWLRLIECLTCHSNERLDSLPLKRSEIGLGSHYEFHGVPLHRKHVVAGVNLCPHCWNQNPYHRASWQLVWKPVCEEHRCPLVQVGADDVVETLGQIIKAACLRKPVYSLVTFSQAQLNQVIGIQQSLTRDILKWRSDAGFHYYQACNYVDRLVDHLQGICPNQQKGGVQRIGLTPDQIIASMLQGCF